MNVLMISIFCLDVGHDGSNTMICLDVCHDGSNTILCLDVGHDVSNTMPLDSINVEPC